VPMVDVLFCLVFAPMVQVIADENRKFFNKVICDGGETVIELTHVLTHYDLTTIQNIRTQLNESLCNEDKFKQAHLGQLKHLMSVILDQQRLSLDVFQKLMILRDEDTKAERHTFIKKLKDMQGNEEDNFFL